VLPSNTYPTAAAIRSSHGLLLPTARKGSEVHSTRAKPSRYVPSSGFGYPLDGLLPRIPRRFCFAPAALLGFTLRRFPLSEGVLGVSTGDEPTYRSAQRYFRRRSVRPARRASVPGSTPSESAWRPHGVLSRGPLAPPMGFAPLGPATKTLTQTSPGLLSRASRVLAVAHRIRRRLRVSIDLRLAPPDPHRSVGQPRQPLWGSCTCPIQITRIHRCPGY
jgi:hypothetical protein